ncbi:MAG: carbohydrate kinase [Lachnospiraceae bacterium]|nr:carbohydrate kinase [Lachnospiraceae bacterium]
MRKKYDVAAIGEFLIDFTYSGISENGRKLFEQNPGGAPVNMLTTVSHMGYRTAFIGKVGKDMHGDFLKQTLEKENICSDYLIQDGSVFTTLAFVEIDEKGERSFSFARKPGADGCISFGEIDRQLLGDCKIFHFGSLSLAGEPARTATIEAVKAAKESGAVISYDPNYRPSLWKNEATAVRAIKSMMPYADFMKVSEEESRLITGEANLQRAADKILDAGIRLAAITLGGQGVFLACSGGSERVPAYEVTPVDTTGAGDSFWGGFLSKYLEFAQPPQNMEWTAWKKCALYGNAAASLCVQRRGGIPAIPTKKETDRRLQDLEKQYWKDI